MEKILKLIVIQEPHTADRDGKSVVIACTLGGAKIWHLGTDVLSDHRIGAVVEVVKKDGNWKLISETPPNDVSMMLANFLLAAQIKL